MGTQLSTEQMLRAENQQLRTDLQELRARLWEPEEIVRAIRQGEVDAFVVSEPPGEQIYSLRSADLLYRRMIEDMKEGAVALDASGAIVYCNPYFAQMVKGDRAALLGRTFLTLVRSQSHTAFQELRDEAVHGAGRRELALGDGDDELVPVLATMNGMRFDGENVACLIVTDLTMQKQNEALVVESRRKDEFLAMLAHELRNPLAPIRNAAQFLRLDARKEALQSAADVIDRQVSQLTRLVDDLLDVSRITRGKISLELETVVLAEVIAGAVETAKPNIEAHGHQLIVELPPEPVHLRADPLRLSQVISNLLNNAAKFTPDGGKILIRAEAEGENATIAVRDTGIGIAPEVLPHVFELFMQADASLGRSQGGLGIGLTLAHSLVEMHGGTLAVRSPGLGQGSEFVISLPQSLADQPALEAMHPTRPLPQVARRFLVVDDNRDMAETLTMLLRQAGHYVAIAQDGESALQVAAAFKPDVMFIDIGLPGMSGYEVARRIRSIDELNAVMLIACTGYGRSEDILRSRAAGFDQHWVKPFAPDALDKLWELVAKSPPQS